MSDSHGVPGSAPRSSNRKVSALKSAKRKSGGESTVHPKANGEPARPSRKRAAHLGTESQCSSGGALSDDQDGGVQSLRESHSLPGATGDTDAGGCTSLISRMAASGGCSAIVLLADLVEDIQSTRIANSNRLAALEKEWGKNLDSSLPSVMTIRSVNTGLVKVEFEAVKALKSALRSHPIGLFIMETHGLGFTGVARYIGAVGDLGWHPLKNRPRTLRELWKYSGLDVVDGLAPCKARGERITWNPTAKKAVHVMATCVVKTGGPFRIFYDDARAKYAEAVHEHECRRCGPEGKPALIGSPLSDSHKHGRALRAVGKEIVRELWKQSIALRAHGPDDGHRTTGAQEVAERPTRIPEAKTKAAAPRPRRSHKASARIVGQP